MKKSLLSLSAMLTSAVLLAAAASADAEFFTGQDLLTRMHANDYNSQNIALGYIIGVHDAYRTVTHCSPDNLTAERLFIMVRSYLEIQTDLRVTSADIVIEHMMRAVWPCAQHSAI
jgi:negative regulator of sigma E activity